MIVNITLEWIIRCIVVVVAPSPSNEFSSSNFNGTRISGHDSASLGGIIGTNVPPGGAAGGAMWSCQHCTYHNAPHQQACDMCGLPRQ